MVKITWVKHACFLIESESGTKIYFDPYEIPQEYGSQKADGILASHDHHDHFDEAAVKLISTTDTEIICPATCAKIIQLSNAHGVGPGDKGTIAGFPFTAVRAYNPNKNFHPKQNDWLGYLVEVDGITIYHAGDTDYIDEFQDLAGKVDVAILPVGDTYTMGFEDGVKAVSTIRPKFVIPMHNWDKDLKKFEKMCKEANPETEVKLITGTPLKL